MLYTLATLGEWWYRVADPVFGEELSQFWHINHPDPHFCAWDYPFQHPFHVNAEPLFRP